MVGGAAPTGPRAVTGWLCLCLAALTHRGSWAPEAFAGTPETAAACERAPVRQKISPGIQGVRFRKGVGICWWEPACEPVFRPEEQNRGARLLF